MPVRGPVNKSLVLMTIGAGLYSRLINCVLRACQCSCRSPSSFDDAVEQNFSFSILLFEGKQN